MVNKQLLEKDQAKIPKKNIEILIIMKLIWVQWIQYTVQGKTCYLWIKSTLSPLCFMTPLFFLLPSRVCDVQKPNKSFDWVRQEGQSVFCVRRSVSRRVNKAAACQDCQAAGRLFLSLWLAGPGWPGGWDWGETGGNEGQLCFASQQKKSFPRAWARLMAAEVCLFSLASLTRK